jgi:hypothetical protein
MLQTASWGARNIMNIWDRCNDGVVAYALTSICPFPSDRRCMFVCVFSWACETKYVQAELWGKKQPPMKCLSMTWIAVVSAHIPSRVLSYMPCAKPHTILASIKNIFHRRQIFTHYECDDVYIHEAFIFQGKKSSYLKCRNARADSHTYTCTNSRKSKI